MKINCKIFFHITQARVLQNELLSAELAITYSGIALAKSNAFFFNERGNMSEAPTADRCYPYTDNRVCLQPSSDNKLGYVNASHVTVNRKDTAWFFVLVELVETPVVSVNSNILDIFS